jgi:hypothetical protein
LTFDLSCFHSRVIDVGQFSAEFWKQNLKKNLRRRQRRVENLLALKFAASLMEARIAADAENIEESATGRTRPQNGVWCVVTDTIYGSCVADHDASSGLKASSVRRKRRR